MNAYVGNATKFHVFTTAHWQFGNQASQPHINTNAVSGDDVVLNGWEFPMSARLPRVVYSKTVLRLLGLGIFSFILALFFLILTVLGGSEWAFHASAGSFMIMAVFLVLWIEAAEHEWRVTSKTN
jgi:hypothetical protein